MSELKPNGRAVSWTGRPVSYFVHEIDRTLVRILIDICNIIVFIKLMFVNFKGKKNDITCKPDISKCYLVFSLSSILQT